MRNFLILVAILTSVFMVPCVVVTSVVVANNIESESVENLQGGNEVNDESEISPTITGSYDLFWPVSAGKTKGDSLFFLKTLKEYVGEFFIFSRYRKVDYNITLSVKRLVEAEKLINENDIRNAEDSLENSILKLNKALNLMKTVELNGQNTTDLKNAMRSSIDKQIILVDYVLLTASDEAKPLLENHKNSLTSIIVE